MDSAFYESEVVSLSALHLYNSGVVGTPEFTTKLLKGAYGSFAKPRHGRWRFTVLLYHIYYLVV